MAEANALILLPDGTGVPEGDPVRVLMLDADRLEEHEGGPLAPLATDFA